MCLGDTQARRECVDPWRVKLNHEVRSLADRRNLLFSWAYSAPYVPHQNSLIKGTCEMDCPSNDSHCPKLCRLSCNLITKHPLKVLIYICFGTCKTPAQKFGIFHRCRPTHADTDSLFCFKSSQNRCRISGRKSALYWWQKAKYVLASLGATPGAIPLIFCVSAHLWPLTYIPGFIQIRSTTAHRSEYWIQYRLFEPIKDSPSIEGRPPARVCLITVVWLCIPWPHNLTQIFWRGIAYLRTENEVSRSIHSQVRVRIGQTHSHGYCILAWQQIFHSGVLILFPVGLRLLSSVLKYNNSDTFLAWSLNSFESPCMYM